MNVTLYPNPPMPKNLLTAPEDLSNAAWNLIGSGTRSGNTLTDAQSGSISGVSQSFTLPAADSRLVMMKARITKNAGSTVNAAVRAIWTAGKTVYVFVNPVTGAVRVTGGAVNPFSIVIDDNTFEFGAFVTSDNIATGTFAVLPAAATLGGNGQGNTFQGTNTFPWVQFADAPSMMGYKS